MLVNEATGEVTVELAGEPFTLHATFPRVARFQAELGAKSFTEIHEALRRSDMNAIYQGLKSLCASGNEEKLDGLLIAPNIGAAIDAIYTALAAGLPEGTRGNGDATAAKKATRRGRDTESSPSA